jgi:hypothetical protein
MKYNQKSKKGQEDRNHLFTDAVLEMGLYTSVVKLLSKVMSESNGDEKLEETFQFISKSFPEVVAKGS